VHGRSVRAFLERVPVRVIEHGRNGVLGAARFYIDRRRFAPPAQESTTECNPAK